MFREDVVSSNVATSDLVLFGNYTDNRKFSVRCNGSVFADGAYSGTGADFAEHFQVSSSTTLLPGTVIVIHPGIGSASSTVAASASTTRRQTLGVISTAPGFVGNSSEIMSSSTHTVIVGLLGQILTHVSASSSPIHAGDVLMAGDNGMAVKAKGPGMVLGTAMGSLISGTGKIFVNVNPHWWAGDLFISTANGSLLINDLTNASTTIAASTSTTVDSPLFSFEGSAWNSVSSSVITSQFSLYTDMQSATTSYFAILGSATNTNLLTISPAGDLAISGRFYPSKRGKIQYKKYIFYDGSSGWFGNYMRTNAFGWGSGSYDFAEMFPSDESLESGDVVVVDPSGSQKVKRSTQPGEGALIGIVSTQPGFLGGEHTTSTYPIALAGRVPTKVSTENGTISAGDPLSASSQPGVAMKAVLGTPTVGMALESYDLPVVGSIIAYVNVGAQGNSASPASGGSTAAEQSGFARIISGATSVHVSFTSIGAYPMVRAAPYSQAGDWWISNQTDTGFDIILAAPQLHDVVFSWIAPPTLQGAIERQSDNTSQVLDPTTGQPIPQTITVSTSTTTSGTPTTTNGTSTSTTNGSTATSTSSTTTSGSVTSTTNGSSTSTAGG